VILIVNIFNQPKFAQIFLFGNFLGFAAKALIFESLVIMLRGLRNGIM